MRPTGTPDQLEKRRLKALELLKQGKSKAEVAQMLGTSRMSVHRWHEAYQSKGKNGIKPRPTPGRPSRLSPGQKKKLSNLLLQGALARGYSTDLWTLERIERLIRQQFGIGYHQGHIWHILLSLGWSCQKPERRALQRKEQEIEHWKRYKWPHIKKRSKAWCPPGIRG